MASPLHPSLVADVADIFLVLARWAIDPARPTEPADPGPPGLLERLETVHRETVPMLGPVTLPEFPSLFGGDDLPAFPTLLKRAAEALGQADRLPTYNTIDAAVRHLVDRPVTRLTTSQSRIARFLLQPLERPGAAEQLRAAVIETAPASAFGFAHIVNCWLHSVRLDHPDSYLLGVQRQLVVDDGRLVRGDPPEATVHAYRLLQHDDPWLAAFADPVVRRMLRQLDTTFYLFAAQHVELARVFAPIGFDETLFDAIYRSPYSPRALTNRYFEALRAHAGLSTWDALSLDGHRRVVGANSTSHEQLVKWRAGARRMTSRSLAKLIEHSPGFDPARRNEDLEVLGEGYRMLRSVIAAAARIDDAVVELDSDPRAVLLDRFAVHIGRHRADLDTWVPRPPFS